MPCSQPQSWCLVGNLGELIAKYLQATRTNGNDMVAFVTISPDMIIGFRTDMTTIREISGPVTIQVHSRITSEVEYTIVFRHIRQKAINIATVETADSFDSIFDEDFDAKFGDRPNPNNPLDFLETTRVLQVGHLEPVRPLVTTIFPDLHPEGNESYTINILTTDMNGESVNFMCNENEDNPDDFFCDHFVYILDDDG